MQPAVMVAIEQLHLLPQGISWKRKLSGWHGTPGRPGAGQHSFYRYEPFSFYRMQDDPYSLPVADSLFLFYL